MEGIKTAFAKYIENMIEDMKREKMLFIDNSPLKGEPDDDNNEFFEMKSLSLYLEKLTDIIFDVTVIYQCELESVHDIYRGSFVYNKGEYIIPDFDLCEKYFGDIMCIDSVLEDFF